MKRNTVLYRFVRKIYYGLKDAPYNTKKALDTYSIKRFKDINKGETCFIVGNGPSMTIADLEHIHKLGVKSFGCNKIFLAFKDTVWRPDYYIASDSKIVSETNMETIQIAHKSMFFPRIFKKEIKKGNFYEKLEHDWLHSENFSKDAHEGVYGRETVIIDALQISYYMGFSKIYIIGVDFNYNMKSVDKEKLTFENGEGNYFIKDYAKKGEVLNLPNQDANVLGFQAARKAFEENGREIYNATRGGKLEVFIRKDLDEVFEEIERTKS